METIILLSSLKSGYTTDGLVVVKPVGLQVADKTRVGVCGNLGINTACYVVVVRTEIPHVGCPGCGFYKMMNHTQFCSVIPGHALHEGGLQLQKGVGPLVSSRERRAAIVQRINHLSTARQLRVAFLDPAYIIFDTPVL